MPAFFLALAMPPSAHWLCVLLVKLPTKTAHLPLPPIHLARRTFRFAPKATLSKASMSYRVLTWLSASWVMTLMPRAMAFFSTGSSVSGLNGTTAMASGFLAIRSSMMAACCAASAVEGPVWVALLPLSLAYFLTPVSMRLNQLIPVILTTVTMLYFLVWASAP